ncbi:MAG: type IV-A pilus assembly ATPase PilB [Xanthomonadales bacterium]|nr:type IV-A pilus assembly ATPase PilB [Xanthomonadales bacterium]
MNTDVKTTVRLNGLARRLLNAGALDADTARDAIHSASHSGSTLLGYLIANNLVPLDQLATAAAAEFGIPLVDINALDLKDAPISLISDTLLNRHKLLPVFVRGKTLFVATADPTNQLALDEVSFNSGLIVEPLIVAADRLNAAIESADNAQDTSFDDFGDDDDDILSNLEADSSALEQESTEDNAADEAPVVRFVSKILLDAIRKAASDIHFEPYEDRYRVRYRLDGVLKQVASPPNLMARRIASRLKVMAELDIAERRVPQDGRLKLTLSKKKSVDFRVSTLPTLFGEKIVLRILDSSVTRLGIEVLGFEEKQQEDFLSAVNKPYGMVLVTGPTGSGKTVTLYTALNILNDDGRNISTVEDPVEIRVEGINQVQQNIKAGLTFAKALRSFLRQDPDVIMVGEIRDLETADIAIKAAQTGHLVLSTLHTNDASESITRLSQMGVAAFNIISAVNIVLAQRLVRVLHKCKHAEDIPATAMLELGYSEEEINNKFTLFAPTGCSACTDGYKGRSGIFEVMPITTELKDIILKGGNALEIATQARSEGIIDLRRAALNKVSLGITGLAEINRVTKD